MHLVPSTKISFKTFEKSKSRPTEKMCIKPVSFTEPIVARNDISQHHHREV